MSEHTVERLRHFLAMSWSASTSAAPDEWTPTKPSLGQCAVTALIVQDEFGGGLLRTVNAGVSHYWNRLPSGQEVDLTRDQFDEWAPSEIVVREREYALSMNVTRARYEELRRNVDELL